MTQPNALVVRAPGTNCDQETQFAFEMAGAKSECFHINHLLENPDLGKQFQILCIPGGFSYGDDIAAGRIFANQFRLFLSDLIHDFPITSKMSWLSERPMSASWAASPAPEQMSPDFWVTGPNIESR